MRTHIVTCCIVGLHLFLAPANAQEAPHFFEKLTLEEGLSSNIVTDLAQDDDGFLWIATSDGLNRFDGTEIVQYYHKAGPNSIPHNYVNCLKKLPGHVLAIGTSGGLSFYNTRTGSFRNFYYRQHSLLDEYNNNIAMLEIDHNGDLWAAALSCIFIFDKQLRLKKIFKSDFTVRDVTKERIKFVRRFLPLSNGRMLMYLTNGIYSYDPGTTRFTRLTGAAGIPWSLFLQGNKSGNNNPLYPFKVFDRYLLCLKPDTDSLLLLNEDGRQTGGCYFPYNKYPYVSWSQKVVAIDSSHLLFLFHNYGLAIIPVTWQNNRPLLHTPEKPLLEAHEYGTGLRDRQGNWWLATIENGVQKISPHKQHFKSDTLIDSRTRLLSRYEVVSSRLYNRSLWIATYGDGLFEIDTLSGKQRQHLLQHTGDDTWANFIWNIRQVQKDTLWIGTQAGMFWYCLSDKKNGRLPAYPGKPPLLDSVAITTQFTDSHGLVWMGLGKGNGVCYFDPGRRRFTWYPGKSDGPDAYPLRYPTHIAEDMHGDLWFINDASSRLIHWNRNSGHFRIVPFPPDIQKQLGWLEGMLWTNDSTLWLGSLSCGLIRFRPSSGSFIIYGRDKGLGNSHFIDIHEDRRKRLWLATQGGLSCFDPQTATFANYYPKDGLPVTATSSAFYYDTLRRRLYNGGTGVSFSFYPDSIQFPQAPQKTMITLMQVNGKPYLLSSNQPIKLQAKQNDITVQYASVDLTNGPGTRYAYRLIGQDTGWVMAGSQRQINFSRLAPGNYRFVVRAANSSGIWSMQTASINFIIKPPFTQTGWFYLLIALAIGTAFNALHYFRLRQLRRTEQIRSEISRNLHDEIGANLTNISFSSLVAQKQLEDTSVVNRMLERIYHDSQTVSQALREIVWSINPSIDTLGQALPRMLHYAAELLETKDISLHADIAPDIEGIRLTMQQRRDLYLIFRETVNNMARHSNASHAIISLQLRDHTLVMTITDNGKGFDTGAPLVNNGLRNMQERARSHQWQLQLHSQPGFGTSIILEARIA